jgi:hypothetical protein
MKREDVPQQADDIYEGVKKVLYATNKDGELALEQTAGWEPEIEVLKQAVDEVNRLASEALERVHAGISSPLDYHMHAQRMDLPMLAQSTGYYKWTVKRHCKPLHFARLSDAKLQNYAHTLGMSVEALSTVPGLS